MHKTRDILIQQRKELEYVLKEKFIPRDSDIIDKDTSLIKVVIGPRRAGKSFFVFHQLKDFAYVNFDDERLVDLKDYDLILEGIKEVYPGIKTLFFDEIQNLNKWELFVNRLQRLGFNIFLTGSNSNLLSRELSTHLTGRYVETIIFPFSFKEYLIAQNKEMTGVEKQSAFDKYLEQGGFPEVVLKDINKKQYISTLYNSMIFKDVVLRYNIKSPRALEELSEFLIDNFATSMSFNKLTKITEIKSVHTVKKYFNCLKETFLFFDVEAISYKTTKRIKSPKKIYTIDSGFIFSKAVNFSPNIGKLYENEVAIELRKKQLSGELELFYWKNDQSEEVDFVIKKGARVTELIQVCYDLSSHNTKKREMQALIKASRDLKCDNLLILTGDYEGSEDIEWFGLKRKINFIPLWEWLLK